MTHDHIPKKEKEAPQQTPTEKSVRKFADTYNRFKAGFSPTETNGRTWQELDDESDTLQDLKKNPNDPFNQTILEGRWPENELLDDARRDALREYFLAEHGEITGDDIKGSLVEARRAILESTRLEQKESSDLIDGMFGAVAERKAVLNFIEDSVSELNVFIPSSGNVEERQVLERRRDLLRVARIKIDEQYRTYRDVEKDEKRATEQAERTEASQIAQEAATHAARAEVAALIDPYPLATPDELAAHSREFDERKAAAQAARDKVTAERQAPAPKAASTETEITEDSEVRRLRELGFGNTKKEQERNLAQIEVQKQEDQERAAKRQAIKNEKERQAAVLKGGEKNHNEDTSQKRREEEALLEVFEALNIANTETALEEKPTEKDTKKLTPEQEALRDAELAKGDERNKRNALGHGLKVLNNLPPQTLNYLLGKYNIPDLPPSLGAIQERIDLDTFDTRSINDLYSRLQSLGVDPSRRSDIWNEIGRPSSSELERTTQQIERALASFLQQLQDSMKK